MDVALMLTFMTALIGLQSFWINRSLDRLEHRMDRFEHRMDRFEDRMDRFEDRMDRFEERLIRFEAVLVENTRAITALRARLEA